MSISKPYDRNHQGAGRVLGQCRMVGSRASMGAYRRGRAYRQGISDSLTCISSRYDASTSDPNYRPGDLEHELQSIERRTGFLKE